MWHAAVFGRLQPVAAIEPSSHRSRLRAEDSWEAGGHISIQKPHRWVPFPAPAPPGSPPETQLVAGQVAIGPGGTHTGTWTSTLQELCHPRGRGVELYLFLYTPQISTDFKYPCVSMTAAPSSNMRYVLPRSINHSIQPCSRTNTLGIRSVTFYLRQQSSPKSAPFFLILGKALLLTFKPFYVPFCLALQFVNSSKEWSWIL